MALDFQKRIAFEVGELPLVSNEQLDQVIQDALEAVIAQLPNSALYGIAEKVTDSGSGVALGTRKLLKAYKGDYEAAQVQYEEALAPSRVLDAQKPIWYNFGGTAYILPGGGDFLASQLLTADRDTSSITGANTHFDALVVLRASLDVLRYKMNAVRKNLFDEITLPTAPTLPAAPSFTYTDVVADAVSSITIGAFGTAPTYTPPSLTPLYTDFDTYFSLEDTEITQAALSKLGQQLNEFQASMQSAMNTFGKENVEYQASIQREVEEARLEIQRLIRNAQSNDQVELANRARQFEQQVTEYQQTLARHSQEIANYQAQIQAESVRFQQNMSKAPTEVRMLASDAQRLSQAYAQKLQEYIRSYSSMAPVRPKFHEF